MYLPFDALGSESRYGYQYSIDGAVFDIVAGTNSSGWISLPTLVGKTISDTTPLFVKQKIQMVHQTAALRYGCLQSELMAKSWLTALQLLLLVKTTADKVTTLKLKTSSQVIV